MSKLSVSVVLGLALLASGVSARADDCEDVGNLVQLYQSAARSGATWGGTSDPAAYEATANHLMNEYLDLGCAY